MNEQNEIYRNIFCVYNWPSTLILWESIRRLSKFLSWIAYNNIYYMTSDVQVA